MGHIVLAMRKVVAWQRDYTIIFDIDKNLQELKMYLCAKAVVRFFFFS